MRRDQPSDADNGQGSLWYQPLAKARLSDRVADAILNSISERGLAPGDRIPTEKQLGEQFGVSRTVVREAVRSLEAQGIVRGGPGMGRRVAAVDGENVTKALALFIHGRPDVSYEQLRDVRAMLEIEIAGRAAERATPEDIERLSKAADRIEQAEGGEATYDADVAFHRVIADATHNELYVLMLDSISDVLVEGYRRISATDVPGSKRVAAMHLRIADAITGHDPKRARDEVRKHMETGDRAYRRYLAEQSRIAARTGLESVRNATTARPAASAIRHDRAR